MDDQAPQTKFCMPRAVASTTPRERLAQAVAAAGGAAVVAEESGLTRSYIQMILNGSRRPGLRPAVFFERSFGIPCAAWLLDDERRTAATEATEA